MRELPPTAGLPLSWRDLGGPRRALEPQLAPLLGKPDMLPTCSGTAALVIALSTLAADSDRRDVIVPAYTCPLVALAIARCGLTVRPCDLAGSGIAMDAAALAALCGPRTLAVVPTHLGGRVVDVAQELRLARACGAFVIEDAAQALGARHADATPAGLAGDIGFYSLAAGKGLTTYEGGLLVTRHAQLYERMRRTAAVLAPRRRGWEVRRSLELAAYAAFYRPRSLALVYGHALRRALRRGDIEGAAGDVFPQRIPMHRLGRWRQSVAASAARRLAAFLDELAAQAQPRRVRLAAIPGLTVIDDAPGARGTWPYLLLLLPSASTRDAVLARLWGAGVGIAVPFARALPDYAFLRGKVPAIDVPRARDFATRVLTITNSPWLDAATFARIAEVIERACAGHAAAT